MQNRANIFDPEKWLRILQRWRPRERREVLIDFIKSLIEAAGRERAERLDALFIHTDETTRSAREKFDRLRRWRDAMRSDPWFWPQLVERERPVSILVKKIVDESPRPLTRFEVERKFRRYRKVPSTGLAQELKELANRGEIDRHKQGLYWGKGTAAAPCESHAQRAYKLVYSAADQCMHEAELAVALGLSRNDIATIVSQMRKRGLFAPATGNGIVVASAESIATLQRGPIFDGRGGIFLAAPERAAPLADREGGTRWLLELLLKNPERRAEAIKALKQPSFDNARKPDQEGCKRWFIELLLKYPERPPRPVRKLLKEAHVEFRVGGRGARRCYEFAQDKTKNTKWSATRRPGKGVP